MKDGILNDQDIIFDDEGLPFATAFGDHYYSRHDGRAETEHVFLAGNDISERWRNLGAGEAFTIGELGFGTGLNFLVTWANWLLGKEQGSKGAMHFVSVEAFPMSAAFAERALAAWPELAPLAQQLLAQWPFENDGPVSTTQFPDDVRLTVHHGQAEALVREFPLCNAWYLDGFAPARNESMWGAPLLQTVFDRTAANGTFASYTAAGQVRRDLAQAGFMVEKRAGFGRKRDMIGGYKPDPASPAE